MWWHPASRQRFPPWKYLIRLPLTMAEHIKTDNSITIREEERRRADNQIWNAAGAYDYVPEFRAYDRGGHAELYWNSMIGAVQKHYASELDPLWAAIRSAMAEDICEQLAWICLENACYERESLLRPAFPLLRKAYAEKVLYSMEDEDAASCALPEPYRTVLLLHFKKVVCSHPGTMRAASADTELKEAAGHAASDEIYNDACAILDRIELPGDLSGAQIAQTLLTFLDERTLLIPKEQEWAISSHKVHIPFLKRKKKMAELPPVRSFAGGIGEHGNPYACGSAVSGKHVIWDMSEQQSEAQIADFVRQINGTAILSGTRKEQIEHLLCRDDHQNCHLYFARGDQSLAPDLTGYAGIIRRDAIRQMTDNRAYYEEHYNQTRTAVNRLKEKWQNAFLTNERDHVSHSDYGKLRSDRIWRSEFIGDDRIFDREIITDNGRIYVDLLLDASLSQQDRQQRVALQAYIIAEALTACHIPVRISSFYSLSGYTVLTQYRDYSETDANTQVFNYTTFGGNRDGLAIKLLGHIMENAPEGPDRRILLVLSDTKPNDAINISSGGRMVPYKGEIAADNTAREVRYLSNRGITVLCIYTGEDTDLSTVHKIYNRDFVRIRDLDHFAQAVGGLILTQITR